MIFSDKFTVHERYSLVSGEQLSDYSEMPWLYTPLVDSRYKPSTITDSVKNNLNRFFEYDYLFPDVLAIKEEEKYLGIYHDGDEIQSYRSLFKLRYSVFRDQRKDFMRRTETLNCQELYDKMDEIVQATSRGSTLFLGSENDVDGNVSGLIVGDRNYDLSSYNNPLLDKVNWYSNNAPNFCKGLATVRSDNEISFYSGFVYPKTMSVVSKEEYGKNPSNTFSKKNMIKVSNRQALGKHLAGYKHYEILNEQQIYDAIELVPDLEKDARMQIEHVFRGSELIDIIAHVVKFHHFEEIEVKKRWFNNFDENGQRIW